MVTAVITPPPTPATFLGPAITGKVAVEAQAMPSSSVPPTPTVLGTANSVRRNPFVEKILPQPKTEIQRTSVRSKKSSTESSGETELISPTSPFFLVQLMAQSANFGEEIRQEASEAVTLDAVPDFIDDIIPPNDGLNLNLRLQSSAAQLDVDTTPIYESIFPEIFEPEEITLAQDYTSPDLKLTTDTIRAIKAFAAIEALVPDNIEFEPTPDELPTENIEFIA